MEELENTIKKLQLALDSLGDINMSCSPRERNNYQKRLNKSFDILYSLKKHLEFVRKMEEMQMGHDLDDEELEATKKQNQNGGKTNEKTERKV